MRTLSIIAATFVLSLTPALWAQPDDKSLRCLRENIAVTVEPITLAQIESREVTALVSNNTSAALGGVYIEFEIYAAERPRPLYTGVFRDLATIAGGLLPGESMRGTDYHFMEDRELGFATASSDLSVRATIFNAADEEMRGFFDGPSMGSWDDEVTQIECSPNQ